MNAHPHKVIFRIKAGLSYGWGHLVRAVNLALSLRESALCGFVVEGDESAEAYIKNQHFQVICRHNQNCVQDLMLKTEMDAVKGWGGTSVVFDMLRVPTPLLSVYKSSRLRTLVLSDEGFRYPLADKVIYPNPKEVWQESPLENTLAGSEYVMVADEFRAIKNQVKFPIQARTVFINSGGSITPDRFEKFLHVIELLEKNGLEGIYVTGQHKGIDITKAQSRLQKFNLLGSTGKLPEFVKKCDMAFCTAGYIRYELASAGFPMVLTGVVDHQLVFARFLEQKKIAVYAGDIMADSTDSIAHSICKVASSSKTRKKLSQNALSYIDGLGYQRVTKVIMNL